MGGQPLYTAFCAAIIQAGGIDGVCARIVDGESVTQIAKSHGGSRSALYRWLSEDDARKLLFRRAREESAHGDADKAGEVLEVLIDPTLSAPSSEEVGSRRAIADHYRWLAGVKDRAGYGVKPGTELHISVGELHLTALRAQGDGVELAPPAGQLAIQDGSQVVAVDPLS